MKRSLRELAARVRARVRRLTSRGSRPDPSTDSPAGSGNRGDVHRELTQLRNRVAQLERELTETQRLSGRVAELVDLVQEVLLPAASRDDARLKEVLSRYDAGT